MGAQFYSTLEGLPQEQQPPALSIQVQAKKEEQKAIEKQKEQEKNLANLNKQMKDLSVEGTSTINTEVTEFKYDPEAEFKERLWSWHGMLEEEDQHMQHYIKGIKPYRVDCPFDPKKVPKSNNSSLQIKKELQKHFADVVRSKPSQLRKVGIDITRDDIDHVFELGLIIDLTRSMDDWIIRAKETLIDIAQKVIADNVSEGNVQVRISIIGYRDYTDRGRFMVMPFSNKHTDVKKFLDTFEAMNYADIIDPPEDVQGALKLMLMQDWTLESIKRIVLICDSPCHNAKYDGYGGGQQDNFKVGIPFGYEIKDLMREMVFKNIGFQFLKLSRYTDRMESEMQLFHKKMDIVDIMKAERDAEMAYQLQLRVQEMQKKQAEEAAKKKGEVAPTQVFHEIDREALVRKAYAEKTQEAMQGQMNSYWCDREVLAMYNRIINAEIQAPAGFWEQNPHLKNPEDGGQQSDQDDY